ncbi:MAG: hypothetical protein EBZ69_04745, partial [Alphaproteobacteria bacterium]|nr:hypothetical protein [Alphaproteobacteria bacterium]
FNANLVNGSESEKAKIPRNAKRSPLRCVLESDAAIDLLEIYCDRFAGMSGFVSSKRECKLALASCREV